MTGLARGGTRYVGVLGVAALLFVPLSRIAAGTSLVLALFVAWFYRDPERNPPTGGIVAPADGRVSVIREEEDRLRVGVFMNVTDVHVNRAPLGGAVQAVEHSPGAHRPAFTKDSERNERVRIDLDEYEVVLIAGAFARRITPYVEEGKRIERGDRIGHIAFGSRVDVLLPSELDRSDLRVGKRESVRAGETVIAPEP